MTSYQLSLFEYSASVCAYVCVRVCFCVYVIECVESLVGVCRVFLTYILLSTINSEEICVNQRPLQPASLLPLAQ